MRRRDFLGAFGGAAIVWPLSARAQDTKVWRIGVLETISPALNAANFDAFRNGLRVLGDVEGKNILFEYRTAEGRNDRFPTLAKELVDLKVDVIMTRGTPAALAAKNATSTIPVVMAAMGEPLMIVPELSRPGGNVTGLSSFVTELQGKRIEVLQEVVPSMARVAALLSMGNPVTPPQWTEIEAASRKLNIESILFDVRVRSDLQRSIEEARSFRADALIMGTGALLQDNAQFVVELATKHWLPTMHVSREWVDVGGLVSYGPSYPDLYRRSAAYVDKILKGANPGQIPVEQPVKFELIINLKTAKALGLTVPGTLLIRADEVIE